MNVTKILTACCGLLLGAATPAAAQQRYTPWRLYNKGVKWQKSLQAAQAKAKKERKLVLYYLNTGDIDKFETS